MGNAVLFISDEHNPFYSSVYGGASVSTPCMSALANAGTVFENAYTPSPLCVPARCAFLSGRRVHETGAYSNCVMLLEKFETYGEALSRQGVHSVYVGKTDGCADAPLLGFDEMLLPSLRPEPGDCNFWRKPLRKRPNAANRAGEFGVSDSAFDRDTAVVDAAVKWLEEKAVSMDKPFMLTVSVVSPHFPAYATEEYWHMYDGKVTLPRVGAESPRVSHPYVQDLRYYFSLGSFTQEQALGVRQGYFAQISYVDAQIGRVLDKLKELGLDASTDFYYVSDHGDMMGKHGLWWKNTLFEDASRIPCIAAGPGFAAGKRVKTPVDLLDVQASLFSSCGVQMPHGRLGTALQQIAAGENPDRAVFSEYHGHGTRAASYMIRKGDYKLIYCCEGASMLFDVKNDPDELNDLYDAMPEKRNELIGELYDVCDPHKENANAFMFQTRQRDAIIEKYPDKARKIGFIADTQIHTDEGEQL